MTRRDAWSCLGQIPDPSEDQRHDLQRWLRRSKTSQALALRARTVLESAEGKSDTEVAGQLGTTGATVSRISAGVRVEAASL